MLKYQIKLSYTFITLLLVFSFIFPSILTISSASAEDSPTTTSSNRPPEPRDNSNPPNNSSDISHTGANTISSDTESNEQVYSSTASDQNSLLVTGGTSTIINPIVTKSGDSDGDNADFYGTNAAIFVGDNATLNINGGSVTTSGAHANAIFSYGSGVISAEKVTISTTANNSGGFMVTGGGTINATNCTVTTAGNSSAPIRSDRGGGTLTVDGGTFESDGVGSPVIYSTADISVKNALLTSTASEGVVVEGKNSVALDNVTLTDTNNTLNGQSETYKNIFLYQSMSGDAEEGASHFSAKDSQITTNQGDTFFVTNTTAVIDLENNTFTNSSDGALLRISTGPWGNSGENGGQVTMNLTNQKISGDIIIDDISSLDLSMKDSVLIGSIDTDNQAKSVNLTISSNSILSLTVDTYVDTLNNEDSTNSNIYSNGSYKLYVGGEEVSINSDTYVEATTTVKPTEPAKKADNIIIYVTVGLLIVIVIFGIVSFLLINHKNKKSLNSKLVSTTIAPSSTPTTSDQTTPTSAPTSPQSQLQSSRSQTTPPTSQTQPIQPAQSSQPVQPNQPIQPNQPVQPNQPIQPNQPVQPTNTLDNTPVSNPDSTPTIPPNS